MYRLLQVFRLAKQIAVEVERRTRPPLLVDPFQHVLRSLAVLAAQRLGQRGCTDMKNYYLDLRWGLGLDYPRLRLWPFKKCSIA